MNKTRWIMVIMVMMAALAVSGCGAAGGERPRPDRSGPAAPEGASAVVAEGDPGQGPSRPGGREGGRGANLTEEQAAAIAQRMENTSYVYDAETQTLTVSHTFTEEGINQVVNATLEQAGYGPANVDLVSGGMVVTIEDFSHEGTDYGDVVIGYDVTVPNCRVDVTITEASAGGTNIPPLVLNEVNSRINAAWEQLINEWAAEADLPRVVDWCVTDLSITETDAAITVLFRW